MAVRRTRDQKSKAQLRREQNLTYSYVASTTTHPASPATAAIAPRRSTTASLFGYDTHLIFADLRKTILITITMLVCLAGIYWYMRSK